ncbi:MAG: hypothetical protein M3P30_08025 [Chloroflexota bacterium]|nr:hypothetical protein [Chloroflexota bacterium]
MVTYLHVLRGNWDAALAFTLMWLAIAITLGPGYYFLSLYLTGCAYIIKQALKRPPQLPPRP